MTTVADVVGDRVDLTRSGGVFTFKMPAGGTKNTASFKPLNFFVDVPVDAYYYDAVLWAARNGITEGTTDTTFSPNSICTRAEIVTFLYRLLGK